MHKGCRTIFGLRSGNTVSRPGLHYKFFNDLQIASPGAYRRPLSPHTLRVGWKRAQSSQARPIRDDEELFRYTSGRFIHDEARQLAERYVPFNVAALKDLVRATCRGRRVVGITKTMESKWSKDLAIALEDGTQVMARLPTRLAPLPQYDVPSQVATMEYVRTRLGVPAPKVLAYSADTDTNANPVGTPYILMEHPRGINLAFVWPELSDALKDALLVEWVQIEVRMTAAISDGYGSIFYRHDVPTEQCYDLYTGDRKEAEFVIGPYMDLQFWDGERRDLDIHRGPFATSLECLLALSAKERAWIKQYAIPKKPEEYGWLDLPEIQKPELHLELLDRYDSIAPYLVPPDPKLFRPTLLPNDRRASTIYISQEALDEGRIEITSVWDWQFASMHPCFQAVRVPHIFRHDETPPDAPQLKSRDAAAEETAARRHALYLETTRVHNPVLHNALAWPLLLPVRQTLQSTHDMWAENYVRLAACVLRVHQDWPLYAGLDVPCPLRYTREEIEADREVAAEWQARMDVVDLAAQILGVDRTGEVYPPAYEEIVKLNEKIRDGLADEVLCKQGGLDRETCIRGWPWKP